MNEGQDFFRKSSYSKGDEVQRLTEEMAEAPKILGTTNLPAHTTDTGLSRLIAKRRSKRLFLDKPISIEQLSYLLWATQGITGQKGEAKLRAVASAGNRHCFNTYVITNRIEGLKKGIHLYDPDNNSLGLVKDGDFSKEMLEFYFDQKMIVDCSAVFIWTAVTAKMTMRYALRGYRYMFIDAGHVGAHFQLACEDVGLGSCNMAAFYDWELAKTLNINPELELPIYIAVAGWTE
jgi:SagB-type dehydrogenase family enzyme